MSFTHLIGYALVRALDDFPEMNNAFAEVDGKPVLVTPEHAAARRRGPRRHEHGRLARRCRPRPACARCRPSCSPTTASSSTTTCARARGGKVSFTHLIGYAMVRALARLPGDEQLLRRGRRQAGAGRSPSTSTSASPSTCPSKDGSRSLVVAVDQGRRDDGLRRVLERLRGHHPAGPRRQADHGRLRRHDDQPDQPGHHRHQPLGAAADGRARARSSASARWSTRPSSAA